LLAKWFDSLTNRIVPWLRARTRWQVICAELLLDRLSASQIRSLWPLVARWGHPADTLAAGSELQEIARWLDRGNRAERVLELAERLNGAPGQLDDDQAIRRIHGVNEALADLAVLAVPTGTEDESEEPVLVGRGVLRVVARFTGEHVDRRNRLTDGRLATARMVGNGIDARDAHLGLIELAAGICRPAEPLCIDCPLSEDCHSSQASAQRRELMF
jgi:DNA (cytosine-5)-methyltransferase 1